MIAVISAPTNLGLRPPEPGGVPGAHKAPEALREAGLHQQLLLEGAREAGIVLPGRYVDDDATRPPGQLRNQEAIVDHARRLGGTIAAALGSGQSPLVLGGDCSVLVGVGLGLAGKDRGLVHVDGHTDFRHPGISRECASLAGEDLAAAVGLHWPAVADIDGLGPYFQPSRTAHLGCRVDDEGQGVAARSVGLVINGPDAVRHGLGGVAAQAVAVARPGFWLHLDVDVLDPAWMPAVDSPAPGGWSPEQLLHVLTDLAPAAVGASVTILDPDLDPDGTCTVRVRDLITIGLSKLGKSLP